MQIEQGLGKKIGGGKDIGGKKGSSYSGRPEIVIKQKESQSDVNLDLLPNKPKDMRSPERMATLLHFGDYLSEIIKSKKPLDEKEKLALHKIRKRFNNLARDLYSTEFDDWADYVFGIIQNLDGILEQETDPDATVTKRRNWFVRLFSRKENK